MSLKFEKQGEEFSWQVAKRNAMRGGRYIAIAITTAVFIIEMPDITSKDLQFFIETGVYLPALTLVLGYIGVLLASRYEWWWPRWIANSRRKNYTYACVTITAVAPLFYPPVWDVLSNSIQNTYLAGSIFLLFLYFITSYAFGRLVGTAIAWASLRVISAVRFRVKLAQRIHHYFWDE